MLTALKIHPPTAGWGCESGEGPPAVSPVTSPSHASYDLLRPSPTICAHLSCAPVPYPRALHYARSRLPSLLSFLSLLSTHCPVCAPSVPPCAPLILPAPHPSSLCPPAPWAPFVPVRSGGQALPGRRHSQNSTSRYLWAASASSKLPLWSTRTWSSSSGASAPVRARAARARQSRTRRSMSAADAGLQSAPPDSRPRERASPAPPL